MGYAAKAIRLSQVAQASCGFSAATKAEDLLNCPAAGEAQTSVLVFRGQTPGEEGGETASDGAIPALYFGKDGFMLDLEDDKVYALKATASMAGYIGGVLRIREMTLHGIAKCVAGTATVVDQLAGVSLGDSAAAPWTLAFSQYNEGVTVLSTTGSTTAKMRVACRLEFTEVIFPEPPEA